MDNENSSSDSDSVVDETDEGYSERNKRSVGGTEWCGTSDSSPPPRAHVEWPPTEGQGVDLRNSFFGNQSFGNPDFGQRMQLFSRTNHFLAAYPDGIVRGTQDNNDLHTLFEILNAGDVGQVKILSLSLDKYVAMNANGRLYVQDDSNNEDVVFFEKLHNGYNVYLSKAYQHENWCIGINKLGNGKRGRKTNISQKSVQFLPVRRKFE